jgi:DNA repair protein RadC
VTPLLLADLEPDRRPRERMLRLGPDALSDVELVALLLGSGRRGVSALDAARELLEARGGLAGLAQADPAALVTAPGVGPAKATRVVAALALARRFGTSTDRRTTVRTPADAVRIATPLLRGPADGRLVAVAGDRASRLLGAVVVPGADAHAAPFPVREVLAETLRRGGVTLALVHRHEPDHPDPLPADCAATAAVARAAAHCGVRLLDHLVLAGSDWSSVRPQTPADASRGGPAAGAGWSA